MTTLTASFQAEVTEEDSHLTFRLANGRKYIIGSSSDDAQLALTGERLIRNRIIETDGRQDRYSLKIELS